MADEIECLATAPEVAAKPSYSKYSALAETLNTIRTGVSAKGKKRPKHLINQDVLDLIAEQFFSRGEMFRAPYPYYLDRGLNCLMRLDNKDPNLMRILRALRLHDSEDHTKLVLAYLENSGRSSPERELQRFSVMTGQAIYLNIGRNMMLKISVDRMEELPIGTDGIILIAPDLGPWPPMAELLPLMDAMRPAVGNACTRLLPSLPLSRLLTTRWSTESPISPAQAHSLFLGRLMFMAAASLYSLWPLVLITGEQGTGKSTPLELVLTFLRGVKSLAQTLPAKEDSLVASVTNRSLVVYDNIDGARLSDPIRSTYNDLICHLSTGADVDMRILFTTNDNITFRVRNHAGFTARVNPFDRSDVMRRCLPLETEAAAADGSTQSKDALFAAVLAERPAMLAEFALRAQNILKAHAAYGDKAYKCQTEMSDYEVFTYRCAEFEGTLKQNQQMWTACMVKYREAITSSNPMTFAVRLWLGLRGNAGREMSPTGLFAEMRNVHEEVGQKFLYTAPNAFGMALQKQASSLKILGYTSHRTATSRIYKFTPDPAELERCRVQYKELLTAQVQRAASFFGTDYRHSPRSKPPTDHELDELDRNWSKGTENVN
jgi:hypothetical protein